MLIRKKPPRPHAPGEPLLYDNHPRPVTRRELLSAGMLGASGLVMAPAWLAALFKPGRADGAITLSSDIQNLATDKSQCNISQGAGLIPFICFDLAGGANLVGSEVIVGVQGGQANFLSTAGYGKMGVPGNMVPTAAGFVSNALGLLWHSDGAILRGIMTKATSPATTANTNGAVFPALSENDTNINPHNPMYGIATVGANGSLLTLVGTEPTISGGNSVAPPNLGGVMINSALQPSTIDRPSDAVGLVSSGSAADELSVAVQESQVRISGGTAYTPNAPSPQSDFTGVLTAPVSGTPGVPGVQLYADTTADAALKNQVRCSYVKAAYNSANYGNPSDLDPQQDANITGGGTPIFTAADFSDRDVAMTATVMKLVLNGFAGAGTISLGGFDYHDNTRATGETRNFKAGQMIGAVLEYAQRLGKPVMIYVFSDGSLTSSSMVDSTPAGRGKLAWQGDSSSVASTFFLLYNPNGRTQPINGAASQQIGYFSADGSVVSTSSPGANSVVQLVEMVVLNYLSLHTSLQGQFATKFPQQGLGSPTDQAALIAFPPIV
jgi:hypothetical protein